MDFAAMGQIEETPGLNLGQTGKTIGQNPCQN